jgi:hypothetical protein
MPVVHQVARLTPEMRTTRQSKLAAVISSNSTLQASQELCQQLAASYESSVAGSCAGDANAHKARMLQLLSGCRAATGLLELPELSLLSGPALIAVLRAGVAGVVAAAQQRGKQQQTGGSSPPVGAAGAGGAAAGDACQASTAAGEAAAEKAVVQLQQLAKLTVTADALEATGVAATVKKLRKHGHTGIAAAASKTIAAWRATVARGSS